MIHNDIINPLLNDFLSRVTGFGGKFFKSTAITRLNDFTDYLSELTYPDFKFAFYPLKQDQNIGEGKYALGIGNLASGTNIFFRKNVNWTKDGIYLNSIDNCGEIDFSGNVVGDFQFRKDEASVFYFVRHGRESFPTSFYRPSVDQVPYFCFDLSTDHFSVTAPNFSKNRFRQRGTTYIYDEIYGEDKKGMQIDWSQKPTEKYYLPESFTFYQMDKGLSGHFFCLNSNIFFDYYQNQAIYGKDQTILSGKFQSPYSQRSYGFPATRENTEYFFPRRMVIGAGVSNMSEKYDVDGLDHTCAAVLILQGDFSKKSLEIATKLKQAVGLLDETFIGYQKTDKASLSAEIKSIQHVKVKPKSIPIYRNFSSVAAKIKSIFLRFIGTTTFDSFFWGLWGTTSTEWVLLQPEVSGGQYVGVLDYKYPILGSIENKPITGFISGFLNADGTKNIFSSTHPSGKSGYFWGNLSDKYFFPPYKQVLNENIVGFISGNYDEYGNFEKLTNNLFVSGYFLGDEKFFLNPEFDVVTKNAIGFISGVLDENNSFSGFHESNIYQTSGYIENGTLKPFPPYKYVSGIEPVIGYIKGFISDNQFYPLTESVYLYDQDGNITGTIDTDTQNISGYYYKNEQIPFPRSTGGFDGFNNMPYFYPDLGYEYSGFFVASSGLLFQAGENTGYATGFIGFKAAIYTSGNFNEFNDIEGLNNKYDYIYEGFFVGETSFSGIDIGWEFIEGKKTGILTGFIGTYKEISPINSTISFDGKPGFDAILGYKFSGFFVNGSKNFTGITGNEFGFGMMTGVIGYRGISDDGVVEFNNFTGLPNIDPTYYANVFVDYSNVDNFKFSGINGNSSGLGIFTGIISSGNFAGDIAKFSVTTGISNYTGYDFQVSGLYYDIGVITGILSITGYLPPPDNDTPLYYSGLLDYTGFTSMDILLSGLEYYDGIYDIFIGSGISGESVLISGEYPPVIGFLSGYMNESGQFSGFNLIDPEKNSYGYFISGIKYFLPTGDNFSGFEYIDYLNTSAGFDFSGFFAEHVATGYVGNTPGSGDLTGYIGVRRFFINPAENFPEPIYLSGNVDEIFYKTGFLDIDVSGITGSDLSLVFPSGDFVSGTFNINYLDYTQGQAFEIYPYIRAVSGFTFINAYVEVDESGYFEDMPRFGYSNNSTVLTAINSVQYYSLSNEYILEESGISYGIAPFTISIDPPVEESEIIEYKPIGLILTGLFPTIILPPSLGAISDIEELTQDPYFENVVLLLNMSGINLASDLKDSSRYHHKIIATLNAADNFDSGFYNVSGLNDLDIPFTTESGFYDVSGLNNLGTPFTTESGFYDVTGINSNSLLTAGDTGNYIVSVFDNINPVTGYTYLVENGNYTVSVFETINPITGYGYLQESGNYTVSVSGIINSENDGLIFGVVFYNESGCSFGASGISLNNDITTIAETDIGFGASGISLNNDITTIAETDIGFGASGVMLITGTI